MLLEFLPTPNLSKESSLTKPSRMETSLLTSLKTNVINFSHLYVRLPVRERVTFPLLTLIQKLLSLELHVNTILIPGNNAINSDLTILPRKSSLLLTPKVKKSIPLLSTWLRISSMSGRKILTALCLLLAFMLKQNTILQIPMIYYQLMSNRQKTSTTILMVTTTSLNSTTRVTLLNGRLKRSRSSRKEKKSSRPSAPLELLQVKSEAPCLDVWSRSSAPLDRRLNRATPSSPLRA